MSLDQGKMMIAYDRKRTSTLTLDEQPGAHTGNSRQYIPGYSDSNIVYLDTASGNDSNDGSTELLAKLTYASVATAAGSTKKIRVINDGATLSTNITKPTEMKRGLSGAISSSLTAPVDTWTQAGTPSFGSSYVLATTWVSFINKFVAVGYGGKVATSPDGDVWTQKAASHPDGTGDLYAVTACNEKRIIVAVGNPNPDAVEILYSTDGETWQSANMPTGPFGLRTVIYSKEADVFIAAGGDMHYFTSTDGVNWELSLYVGNGDVPLCMLRSEIASGVLIGTGLGKLYLAQETLAELTEISIPTFSGVGIYGIAESESVTVAVGAQGKIARSTDGETWVAATTPSFGTSLVYEVTWIDEIQKFVAVGASGKIAFSSDGDVWTQVATPSFSSSDIFSAAYGGRAGKLVAVGVSGKIAYSTAYANTISASVAGFSIQAVQYSGTPTLYNCILRNPGTTAAVSLNGCRVNYGAEIDADSGAHRATLFIGDTYFTTTPASQNAFSLNSNTFGGRCYILNSSQTGYEQIRDNLFADGITATWGVTVSGRDNVQGVSSNALFGFEVTFNDPKFVDETDYALQYQTNGYDRNSLAAGRSNIYYNSAGGRRDIGAWSYIESAVSYYHAKTAYISKPTKISVTYEETVSEQQGDNGPVSVYTKPSRVKEILTLVYDVTDSTDRAIFDYIRTLTDKGVKVQLFPEWGMNGSTVTVNGNQSAGVEFLTIDAVQVFNGLFLTIAGERYYVLRASPNNTAATKLILDRPLESNVSDNDVITTNYPPGAGEYQFSPPPQLTLEYVDPDTLLTFMRGQTLRFVREWSP